MSALEVISADKIYENFRGLCALGIMTKVPEPGKVKTRLTPPLTSVEAAGLNTCFLQDLSQSIDRATKTSPAQGVGIYMPVGKEAAYDRILPAGFVLIPQRGDGFGERLGLAVKDLLAAGFSSACLINSDSPTVDGSCFAEAANELADSRDRIVIGPSSDGGYYLIGMKKLHRRLFEQIDWSTERVMEQTLDRANEIGVPVHQLPTGYDVDDEVTLRRLCEELLNDPAKRSTAPNTQSFLKEIVDSEGRKRIWTKP
jgi:rSAM/selenodomain-associated transferase 1